MAAPLWTLEDNEDLDAYLATFDPAGDDEADAETFQGEIADLPAGDDDDEMS